QALGSADVPHTDDPGRAGRVRTVERGSFDRRRVVRDGDLPRVHSLREEVLPEGLGKYDDPGSFAVCGPLEPPRDAQERAAALHVPGRDGSVRKYVLKPDVP